MAAMSIPESLRLIDVEVERLRERAEQLRARKTSRYLRLDPHLTDGQHWAIHDKPDAALLELIRTWADEAEPGESITITLVARTPSEVAALPDL